MNCLGVTSVDGIHHVSVEAAEVCAVRLMIEEAPTVGAVTVVEVAPVDEKVTVPVAFDRHSIN